MIEGTRASLLPQRAAFRSSFPNAEWQIRVGLLSSPPVRAVIDTRTASPAARRFALGVQQSLSSPEAERLVSAAADVWHSSASV